MPVEEITENAEPKNEPQSEPQNEPRGEMALRTLAMPGDTNPSGDIFGGWLMGQMDIAGGIVAGMRSQGRVATIAVDGFVFHQPVQVGDVVCCYAEILKIGRTSIKMRVQAWVLRGRQIGTRALVTEGMFTFVAIDENRNKRPVPPGPARSRQTSANQQKHITGKGHG